MFTNNHFRSNEELITNLINSGVLHSPHIIEAFKEIDRADFVPEDLNDFAYNDTALPIGCNQTISQPWTVAFMLEWLGPQKGDQILDIGSGSGWTTALLGYITTQSGRVLGLEIIEELVKFGRANIAKHPSLPCSIEQAGEKLGRPGELFDRILVSAAARKMPSELIDQLTVGGIMVVPVEQTVYRVHKVSAHKYKTKELSGFVFVPLVYPVLDV